MLPPTIDEIRNQLRAAEGNFISARRLAQVLHCSESTLHRRLRARRTNLPALRNEIRAQAAFELLSGGASVSEAARKVRVSPDQLRSIVVDVYKWKPGKIKRAVELAGALTVEPTSRRNLALLKRRDEELVALLSELGAGHPLASWAKSIVTAGDHPEREYADYQKVLRAREKRAYRERRDRNDAHVVMQMPIAKLDEIDVEQLLAEKAHAEEMMRWRSSQRKRQRESGAR